MLQSQQGCVTSGAVLVLARAESPSSAGAAGSRGV